MNVNYRNLLFSLGFDKSNSSRRAINTDELCYQLDVGLRLIVKNDGKLWLFRVIDKRRRGLIITYIYNRDYVSQRENTGNPFQSIHQKQITNNSSIYSFRIKSMQWMCVCVWNVYACRIESITNVMPIYYQRIGEQISSPPPFPTPHISNTKRFWISNVVHAPHSFPPHTIGN